MSIVQVILVCSSPKVKTISKPEPVPTGIKVCPQGIPVLTGFTVVLGADILSFQSPMLSFCRHAKYHTQTVITDLTWLSAVQLAGETDRDGLATWFV